MPMASRMICPATTATTRMIVAYTVARSAVRRRSARVRDAVNRRPNSGEIFANLDEQRRHGESGNGLHQRLSESEGKLRHGGADGVASKHLTFPRQAGALICTRYTCPIPGNTSRRGIARQRLTRWPLLCYPAVSATKILLYFSPAPTHRLD